MKNILMFVNPSARSGHQGADNARAWLNENGFRVLNGEFDPKHDDMSAIIRRHRSETDVVLIGGGDGSVNHALPELIETGLPVLLLPMGTANNLARTLELPHEPEKALALLNTGVVKKIDVGLANGIPFVNVIGLGLSTQVNRLTRGQHKRFFGVFAFMITAIKVAISMTPFRVRITADDRVHKALTWQITVCNGRNYGSGLTIHEQATLEDGRLHGLSTEVAKWWHAFALVPSLMLGRFRRDQDVTTFSGREIEVSTRYSMHVDVDGDIKTRTPVKVTVQREALSIYTPVPAAIESATEEKK